MKSTLQNSRGTALLTVLVAMMMITLLLFEFQYRSLVERKLASNDLDQLRAYYLAKSGAQIAMLRVAIYGKTQAALASNKNAQAAAAPFLDMIWRLPLPAFPPNPDLLKEMERKDKSATENLLEQTKVEEGEFTTTISTETSKINLNHLKYTEEQRKKGTRPAFDQPVTLQDHTGKLLINLMNGFLEDSEDPYEEFGNLRPEEIVFNIMDWISAGEESVSGGFKDAWYEKQDPPYRTKKNLFYTVNELKMVKDIDDHLFNKLKPYVTVAPEGASKINVNEARQDMMRALYPDLTEKDLEDLLEHREELKATGGSGFGSAAEFVSYISDVLGRGGIKDYYPDPNQYPFDVGSESFLIESLGLVRKSASQVERLLQINVALTSEDKGGKKATGTANKDCVQKNNKFIFNKDSQCYFIPTTAQQCENSFAGTWGDNGSGQDCCKIHGQQGSFVCPPQTTGANKKKEPPNSVRILQWTEV